jgi:phosphoglycolate phosphatase-like HAD superfamily hydrolase
MNNNKTKYIMFDFDGTIVDSMPFLENNAVILLTEFYGFSKEEAAQKYRETTGLPFIQQMEIINPNNEGKNAKIVEEFEKMKIERIYEQKLFNDSLDVLNILKHRQYKLGISSGTLEEIIKKYLLKNQIDLVDDILGWKPGFEKGKHHFEYVMEKYSLNKTNLVFIGDSLHDAKRARDNNIKFIGKEGMFTNYDFNKVIDGVSVLSNLTEILEILPKIW